MSMIVKPSEYAKERKMPEGSFKQVERDDRMFDAKFETKSFTFFQDALIRFKKNKASVAATYLLLLIVVYAIFVPFISKYTLAFSDAVYARCRPKLGIFEHAGFWDGGRKMKYNDKYFAYAAGIGVGAADKDGHGATWQEGMDSKYTPILSVGDEFTASTGSKSRHDKDQRYRWCRVESYKFIGFKYLIVDRDQLKAIEEYEKESGLPILYPVIDYNSKYANRDDADANGWYMEKKGMPCDENGKTLTIEEIQANGYVDNYLRDENGNVQYFKERDGKMVEVRVLYYNYYVMVNGFEPENAFGVDGYGNDIFVRMAHGIRLSLLLSFSVSIINFILGSIYGSIAGYYGGWIDLLMERFSDIIGQMPFIIVATLFQLHLVKTGKVSVFAGLLFAFILTGWIGIGYRVRTQFYRFKNQEYILAARTLGASDFRLMYKHIYPNASGTIITSAAFIIPGVIGTETMLSYLGIVNFHGKTIASLGTMLGTAKPYLETDPHILFFPSMILSIMMISFNLFSNGLRDAVNPSLRGAED